MRRFRLSRLGTKWKYSSNQTRDKGQLKRYFCGRMVGILSIFDYEN